jgi:hypothetical protein
MSRKANPLAKYRSYSYYHVLALCNSSDTASELAGSTDLDMWQTSNVGGILSPKTITTSSGEGQYYVLINGSTDAALTITKANWSSFTAASATMNDRGTSIALEGSITVAEPRGIVFLDQIVRCCISMGIDSASAFWVLKTFFVGYTFDIGSGTDGVDHITDIPPVVFLTYDVVGSFGIAGGEYELNFFAAANSAARMPQYSKSVKALNFKAEDNFENTLKKLQTEVTNNYKKYYACVEETLKKTPGTEKIAEALREVKYVITCGAPYAGNSSYIVSDQLVQLKDHPECDSSSNLSFTAGISIEDAIHRIMAHCPQITRDAATGEGGKKYIAKIHSWVTSRDIGGGKLEYEVGYRVDRQEDPHSMSFEDAGKNVDNIIEYDYIYTGKNVDILEFDIKMNMGLVYLQGMTISNAYKQPGQQATIMGTHPSVRDIQTRQQSKNIPVYFGTNIKSSWIRNTQDTQTQSQFAYSMEKHASLESIEAVVKITGNPALLGSINQTSDPKFVSQQIVPVMQDDGYAKFTNWTTAPAFAKINIKMPRNNDDMSLFTGTQTSTEDPSQSNDYAVDFWFTGHYYILGIDHVFDNGEFHQTLQAIGIPANNAFSEEKTNDAGMDVVLDARVGECYENKIGCGTTSSGDGMASGTNGQVPEAHESVSSPNNKIDTYNYVSDNKDLSNIVGYDKAPDRVKVAIHNAALNNPPIQESDLALMIAYESGFRSDVVNKYGYKGLGQFGDSTWAQFGSGNPLDPNANADATAKYMLHNRAVFQRDVSAKEPNVVDLYTMHQRGTTGGTKILKNIYSGNGGGSAGISDKSARANRLPINPSSDQVYQSFIGSLGKRLKSGAVVTKPSAGPRKPVESLPDPLGGGLVSLPLAKPLLEKKQDSTMVSSILEDSKLGPSNVSESTPKRARTAKEVMAAYVSCKDEERKTNDPSKTDNCNKTANQENGGSSGGNSDTGQGGGAGGAGNHRNGGKLSTNQSAEYQSKLKASNGNLVAESNHAINILRANGRTKEEAIAIVANMHGESTMNPMAVGDGGRAYGLMQWHPDRQALYANLYGHSMKSVTDKSQAMTEQVQFANWELSNNEAHGWQQATSGGSDSSSIAGGFARYVERPKDKAGAARTRAQIAKGVAGSYDPNTFTG